MARAISTMLRCDGDALPTTLAAGNYTAQVFGCAAGSAHTAPLTFILAVLRRGAHVSTKCGSCSGYAQQPLDLSTWHSRTTAPYFALDGQHCSIAVLQSAITLECPLNRAKYQFGGFRVMLSMHTQGAARGAVLSLSDAIPPPTSRLHCSPVPVFGTHSFLVERLAALRFAWAANGFDQTLIFARDREHCNALTSATSGVVCEVRMPFASIVSNDTGQAWGSFERQRQRDNTSYIEETFTRLEQPILSVLCLVYAKAAASELLATTDLDELPPPHLMPALHAREASKSAHGKFVGVNIFFDAEHSCPRGFCPSSSARYEQYCSPSEHRSFVKPIVVPKRVLDLGTHAFVDMHGLRHAWRPWAVAKRDEHEVIMWSPCLQHV